MPPDVRTAIESGDIAALGELLAPDVEFRSPAVHRPYRGRETVVALLDVVARVFDDFRYVNEWRDGNTTILRFETRVGERELQGVDILEHGEAGLVERFTVMIRPLSGLQALAEAVAARAATPARRPSRTCSRPTTAPSSPRTARRSASRRTTSPSTAASWPVSRRRSSSRCRRWR